jgi:hypothetical protein
MENLNLKNLTIDKNNLFFLKYSIKQLIYRDNSKEIDLFKFLKDTYLNHKNKKLIYYIYEKSKSNKLLLEQLLIKIKYDTINNKLNNQYQICDYNDKMNNILTNALTQTIVFEHIFKKNEIDNIYKSLIEYYDIDSNDNENIEDTLFIDVLYALEKEQNKLKDIVANNINNKPKLITKKDKEHFTSIYYKLSYNPYEHNPNLYRKMYGLYHQSILLTLEKLNLIELESDWVL